jgi:hypothetical protein
MAKQINQYTKTRTQGTVQDDDLLDFDSTEDSGVSYESAKITIAEFLAYINSNVNNIYTTNGSLPENRVVTSATYYTQFLGGDVTVRMADETFDYGFLVEDLGGTERGRLGYDQATASGEILLSSFTDGDWFYAKDFEVGIGTTTPSSILDVIGDISSTEGYDLGNTLFLHATRNGDRDDVSSGNTYIGDLAGIPTTTGTNNVGIGRGALQSIQSGFNNVSIGSFNLDINTVGRDNVSIGVSTFTNLFNAAQSNCSFNTAIGQNAFANTTDAAGVVGLGISTGTNITIGTDLTLLGRNTGATTAGTYSDSVAIGAYAAFNGNNQCVMGSQNSGASLDNFYFGAGIEATAINPTKITFNITNISAGQTDTASDYDWEFNGSRGTGTGLGGDIYFQTAPAGTTGTAQNALVEALRIKQSGVINMGNLPTSSAGLVAGDLWNNAGVINIV